MIKDIKFSMILGIIIGFAVFAMLGAHAHFISEKTEENSILNILEKLIDIPAPSAEEEVIAGYMAGILEQWNIPVVMNKDENWVIGNLMGKGPKVALIAHIDEPGFILKEIIDDNIAIFEGPFFAPAWDPAELSKFLTYEELSQAPLILNPGGRAFLELHVPEWETSFPLHNWDPEGYIHQTGKVRLSNEQASAAKVALSSGKKITAINKNGINCVSDSLLNDVIIGSPLDNRVGMALILQMALHYKKQPVEDRPNLYIVGRPREEIGAAFQIPEISDSELVIVLDPPAMHFYSVLGGGPVIVWHKEKTPQWLQEFFMALPLNKGFFDFPQREQNPDFIFKEKVQVFEAGDPGLLTVVRNDAGPNVPCFFLGPTMLRYHTSQEKISLSDIEECACLMTTFLDWMVARFN